MSSNKLVHFFCYAIVLVRRCRQQRGRSVRVTHACSRNNASGLISLLHHLVAGSLGKTSGNLPAHALSCATPCSSWPSPPLAWTAFRSLCPTFVYSGCSFLTVAIPSLDSRSIRPKTGCLFGLPAGIAPWSSIWLCRYSPCLPICRLLSFLLAE